MKISLLLLSFLFAALCVSAQVNPQCPRISVTGPAGITVPGDKMMFAAKSDRGFPSTSRFDWTVSAGSIESGQGTGTITVRIPSDLYSYKVEAIVQVIDTSTGCTETLTAKSTGETGPFICGLAPDDYPKLNRNDERARLLNAAHLWSQDPEYVLVFIIQVGADETVNNARRRAAFIQDFLSKGKILSSYDLRVPLDHISIVFSNSEQTHTTVYLIPPSGLASFIKGYSSTPKVEARR